jgi:hypothetical protein
MPARTPLLDISLYDGLGPPSRLSHHNVESLQLVTRPALSGRGCPYRCSY